MTSGFALRSAAAIVAVVASVVACSSSTPTSTAPACDDKLCAPGNSCLPLDGEIKCRKTCTSNADSATSCPFGYTCVPQDDPTPSFCVADNLVITKKDKGQWGSPCNPTGGIDANPDCDTAQFFYCYAQSPTDGNAYCTQYQCASDRDCGAGFYCGSINNGPNAKSAKPTHGKDKTTKVCLKRDYCTPCKADLDCLPVDNKPQHCVAGTDGVTFCAPECTATANCNYDAHCVSTSGFKVCAPRAGLCVGDGAMCSPCHSDADCGGTDDPDAICVKGQYTQEKSCAVKSKKACKVDGFPQKQGTDMDCPNVPTGSKATPACIGSIFPDEVPDGYCTGTWNFQDLPDLGCYTPDR